MKILHILRSEPDEIVRRLIKGVSNREENAKFHLYQKGVNYDQLVKQIFESDRVISWW